MSPAQEKKLDDLFALTLSMKGDMKVFEEKLSQHREAIMDQEKSLVNHDKRIISLDADRNKVKGAMWVSGTTALGGILAFIGSFFSRH